MALILNIDTATEIASVCISQNGSVISYRVNEHQKEHASFLHSAIDAMLKEAAAELRQLNAVAVTAGPGSYTGLRVGLATAKGFCYSLKIPLITINTLQVMALAATTEPSADLAQSLFYCPMIDARRMEVYTALFNASHETVLAPVAMVLQASSFNNWLQERVVLFFGSGSEKLKNIISHSNARFANINHQPIHIAKLAHDQFDKSHFADVAYAEPEYLKEFYSI